MTSSHFTTFTPEAMGAFRQMLTAEAAQRREFLSTLFATTNRERRENEYERHQTAAQAADARRLFVSELRSGVHALRNRFELARRDMVADFQVMANELHAARHAFHNHAGARLNRATRPGYSPPAAHEGVKSAARPAFTPAPNVPPVAYASVKSAAPQGTGAHAEKTHQDKPHDDKPELSKKRHG